VDLARTMAMNTLVVMEAFHLLFIRNMFARVLTLQALRGTRVLWSAIILVAIGQLLITYLPPLQTVFATEAVPAFEVLLMLGIGVLLFVVIEAEKQLRLRLAAPR
jgi:magnesium-transporting ATPase (P-type)